MSTAFPILFRGFFCCLSYTQHGLHQCISYSCMVLPDVLACYIWSKTILRRNICFNCAKNLQEKQQSTQMALTGFTVINMLDRTSIVFITDKSLISMKQKYVAIKFFGGQKVFKNISNYGTIVYYCYEALFFFHMQSSVFAGRGIYPVSTEF